MRVLAIIKKGADRIGSGRNAGVPERHIFAQNEAVHTRNGGPCERRPSHAGSYVISIVWQVCPWEPWNSSYMFVLSSSSTSNSFSSIILDMIPRLPSLDAPQTIRPPCPRVVRVPTQLSTTKMFIRPRRP